GPANMRHMLQGAREGASDAGQSVSRRADRPPAARAGGERADGRELHPTEWDLPPHLLSVAQEVRRPHRDRGHPAQTPGARECPLEGAARIVCRTVWPPNASSRPGIIPAGSKVRDTSQPLGSWSDLTMASQRHLVIT